MNFLVDMIGRYALGLPTVGLQVALWYAPSCTNGCGCDCVIAIISADGYSVVPVVIESTLRQLLVSHPSL